VCICVHVCACVCMCVHVCACVCERQREREKENTHTHTHMHTHAHTHTQTSGRTHKQVVTAYIRMRDTSLYPQVPALERKTRRIEIYAKLLAAATEP